MTAEGITNGVRAHTKVRCRLGTYGPHTNDYCGWISNGNVNGSPVVFTYIYTWSGNIWNVVQQRNQWIWYGGNGTGAPDSSRDFYSNISCGEGDPYGEWLSETRWLQAMSSNGQIGGLHHHQSYIAEEPPANPCPI